MPKVNVYLPDELAKAVKEARVPVSAVCQRALEQAVRRVGVIRGMLRGGLDTEDPTGAMSHFSAKARTVLALAAQRAREQGAPDMGTGHLLEALLDEGHNLALHVLAAMEIDLEQIRRDLAARRASQNRPANVPDSDIAPAANVLELALSEAVSLGHNYIGCEHLLLALVSEPEGDAGHVLRALGADPRLTRRSINAALAGYVHLRAQTPETAPPPAAAQAAAEAVRHELQPLLRRIGRLEEHLGLADTHRAPTADEASPRPQE